MKTKVALTALMMGAGCATQESPTGPAEVAPKTASDAQALQGTNLSGTNLSGANLAGSNLNGTNLAGANLGGTNMAGTNLGGTNLSGTNLAGNNLAGNNLSGTNLGGTNLAGANLGGTNLSGTNLGGSNLSGSNLSGANVSGGNSIAGTNLAGATLTTANVGYDIHNLSSSNLTGLLFSGEDAWEPKATRTKSCVVLGIGSTAFPKLLGQNSGSTMYAAIRKTPWGFSSAADGTIDEAAWEAVVWGSSTYCTFIITAPPATTFDGVAGFVKAIFRWNAPPSKSIVIGSILGGSVTTQPSGYPVTYTGMMNAAAAYRAGTITAKAFLSGEFAMTTATTNNIHVAADFSGWVRDVNNGSKLLANVDSNPPPLAESSYSAIEMPDGSVSIVSNPEVDHGDNDDYTRNCWTTPYFGGVLDVNHCIQLGNFNVEQLALAYYTGDGVRSGKTRPVPTRCTPALTIRDVAWNHLTSAEKTQVLADVTAKCDTLVVQNFGERCWSFYSHTLWQDSGLHGNNYAFSWAGNSNTNGNSMPVVSPYNQYMRAEPGPTYDGSAVSMTMTKSVFPDPAVTMTTTCNDPSNKYYQGGQYGALNCPCSVSDTTYPIIAQVYVHTYDTPTVSYPYSYP